MSVVIHSIGSAVPLGQIDQQDSAEVAAALRGSSENPADSERRSQLLSTLYRRSGVQRRHCVLLEPGSERPLSRQSFYHPARSSDDQGPTTHQRMEQYDQLSGPLGAEACRLALRNAQLSSKNITHLVTVSCSGFSAPGFDLQLFARLDLNPTIARTHVGFMGCHGALNGLRVAKAFAESDPSATILLCAVELCTLHHQYTDEPQQIVANSLFSDGAAAAILRKTEGHAGPSIRVLDHASCWMPETQSLMSWRIGDHGFQMTLSPQVPLLIERELKVWMEKWLAKHGLGLDNIAHWAVHPGGPRILSASRKSLNLPEKALQVSQRILQDFGNMSSPTILFILQEMILQDVKGPIVALAFGPGIVFEAMLLQRD